MKMIASLKDSLPIASCPTGVQPRRSILGASVAVLLAGAALALTTTDASAQQIFVLGQSNFIPPSVSQGSIITSTEVPNQPINGLTLKGITIHDTSGARINAPDGGIEKFVQDPSIEGNTFHETITINTHGLVKAFGLGYVLSTSGSVVKAATITAYNGSTSVGTLNFNSQTYYTFSEGFAGIGSTVGFDRLVITFNTSAASAFAIDNLVGLSSPAHLSISGNFTQPANGLMTVNIASPTSFDQFLISGHAQVGGALAPTFINGFLPKLGEKFTFLTANGGVSGKFGTFADPVWDNLTLRLLYGDNSVTLKVVVDSFAALTGLTPNQHAVAQNVDAVLLDSRETKLVNYLYDRSLKQLPGDFDKISPEELTSIFTIGTSLANVRSINIQRRNDDIRSGSGGFSAAGLAINGSGPSYSGGFGLTTGVAGPNGNDGKEVKETKEVAPAENRWGAFLSGTGEWVSVGNTDNARGYDLSSGGFTLGVDYKVCPNFAVGLAAGYTGTTADLTDHGRVWVNGGKIGLYATCFQNAPEPVAPTMSKDSSKDSSKEAPAPAPSIAKGFYADMAVFGGYNSYDTRRSGLQGEVRGDTDGGELDALFGAGYDFKAGGLTFGPTASFNYTYLGTNGFTEHGSLAPLNIDGGKGESLRTAFGIKASYDWKVGGILIKPEIRAAWQHEYGDTIYSLNSSFANGGGGTFTANGPEVGRDSALLGAGFAIQCSERCSTYFYYDGELGRKNYQSTAVTGGLRLAF